MNLPVDEFTIRFRVIFQDFANDYPMLVKTENDSLQCHGLGPAYGEDQGRIGVYIATHSGKGPHGRGINGTPYGRSHNEGWVKSCQIKIGVWHDICVRKTRRSLSISVDGEISSCEVPGHFRDSDFDMRLPTSVIVAGDSRLNSMANRLHGELSDFTINREADIEIAPAFSITPVAAPAVFPNMTIPHTHTATNVEVDVRLTLRERLLELREAFEAELLSEEEYRGMRKTILDKFCK